MGKNIVLSSDQLLKILSSHAEMFRFEYSQFRGIDENPIADIQVGIIEAFNNVLEDTRPIDERTVFNASSRILKKPVYDYRIQRPHVTGREVPVPNRSELDSFMSTFLFELGNAELSKDKKLEMILGGIPYAQPFEDGNKRLSRIIEGVYCLRNGLSPILFDSRDRYVDLLFDYADKQENLIKERGHYVNTECNSELLKYIKNQ